MTEAAGTLIFGVAAVLTFMMQGRQWPTFITAGIFGAFLAGIITGPVMQMLRSLASWVQGLQ